MLLGGFSPGHFSGNDAVIMHQGVGQMTQNLFSGLFARESLGNVTPCLIAGKVHTLGLPEDYIWKQNR
jgi:hypothetical protein